MSEWQRARSPHRCGGCGAAIAVGDPVLRIAIGRRHTLLRCGACREAPPDLPTRIVQLPEPAQPALVPVRRLAGLSLDWRTRQLGEREPGQEG